MSGLFFVLKIFLIMENKIQHPSKKVELNVLNSSLEEQKKYFEEYWLLPSSQLLLLAPERKESRDLYLSMRRPCKQFVTAVLEGEEPDMELVRKSIVGCSLHSENEMLLVDLEEWEILADYVKENPSGPYLSEEAIELLQDMEQFELAEKYSRPATTTATTGLGSLFTPEMLAKFS